MNSRIHKPSSKSKSQIAISGTTQKSKASTPGFRDSRPEAILQRKLQDDANTSPQVMQLQAIQAMADSRALRISKSVVQRIKGKEDDKIERTYSEVENGNEENVKVGRFGRKRKTLVEDDIEGARTTTETGYQVLTLEEGEKKKEWEIMESVLKWKGNTLCTRNNFKLPVSCIESSEHVIHHHHQNKKMKKDPELIPHHDQDEEKSVGLYFGKTKLVKIPNSKRKKRTTVNTYAANVSTDDIDNPGSGWVDYDFKSKPAQVGEGLFVQSKANGTVFHAVAVVGKKGSKIIVLERNAGNTTGNNIYLDKKWLVNIYANEGDFKKSMGKSDEWRIGKLKVL